MGVHTIQANTTNVTNVTWPARLLLLVAEQDSRLSATSFSSVDMLTLHPDVLASSVLIRNLRPHTSSKLLAFVHHL